MQQFTRRMIPTSSYRVPRPAPFLARRGHRLMHPAVGLGVRGESLFVSFRDSPHFFWQRLYSRSWFANLGAATHLGVSFLTPSLRNTFAGALCYLSGQLRGTGTIFTEMRADA